MTKTPVVTSVALVLAALIAPGPAPLRAQATERSLHVAVVDESGNTVPDLGPSDFIVREDNVAREVLRVQPATDPMQIAVLVDDSQAATEFVRDYRAALSAFITAITSDRQAGGKHSISIITVAARPTIVTPYTFDSAQLLKGANRIFSQTGSGTTLLDGIAEVSQGIVKRESSRPVIIALTSEGPELSDRPYEEVIELLRASGAALHVVAIGQAVNESPDRARLLSTGTKETGGRYENLLMSSGLTPTMKEIAYELTHQYLVTYAHPQSLIPPERVTVTAAKAGLTARGTLVKGKN
jgi:VWFA-related protein